MIRHRIRSYGLLLILGLTWFVAQPGARPLSAQQAGGLPALEKRVAVLEAAVTSLQQTNAGQAADIAALKATLNTLSARLLSVEDKTEPIDLVGTDLTITGVNVFIQDGSGATDSVTGLGNLTVGYNELRGSVSDRRTGTHNLILGDFNNYTSFGGLVVGFANEISDEYATVSGGAFNTASANTASVSGGVSNRASGINASVSGGNDNTASGLDATVSGGIHNVASGDYSSVSGGVQRTVTGRFDWRAGDLFQDQ